MATGPGSSSKGHDFLRTVAAFNEANRDPSSANKIIKMGRIDWAYDPTDFLGGTNPRVLFDGESQVSQKQYQVMAGYYPLPGARVALLPIGTTYLIIGTVDTKPQNHKVDIFSTVGTDTWVKPNGARLVKIQVQAGGGAGGGAAATTTVAPNIVSVGSGGAGGCYAESTLAANAIDDSVTVTVGAGGTPVVGAAGGNGGNSSFGTLVTASGGTGGPFIGAGNNTSGASGPDGVSQTGVGDIVIKGGGGQTCIRIDTTIAYSGAGGTAFMGTGGLSGATFTTFTGEAGKGYGGAGSGSINRNTQSAIAGGAGAPGVVIVTTYF